MTGTFILSLDCEGKWGVADHLDAGNHATLTDARLRDAYRAIIDVLDRYKVPATFAFVGVFAEPADRLRPLLPLLEEMDKGAGGYLAPALADMRDGTQQGWHGDWALDMVQGASSAHEIGLHGVTHVPWGNVDAAFIDAEASLLGQLSNPTRQSRTFIYPRNKVGHVDRLGAMGIEGYRAAKQHSSRAASLLSEFALGDRPEPPCAPQGDQTVIPAGYFLNFKAGLRRFVPTAITVKRGANMLDRAARDGGIVHYWLHPENLAAAPATIDALEGIVRHAAQLRDAGACDILTQANYVDRQPARATAPAA